MVAANLKKKPRLHTPVKVVGIVKERPVKLVNTKIITGKIEFELKKLTVLNQSQTLPFPIDNNGYNIDEALKLKYRYLDLRRRRLLDNLTRRSQMVDLLRRFLIKRDFLEVETPILTKSTPEGARDFLVPSRLQPGYFYALPQSPQQYKQLLMVAGVERYFQFARCLRDEDPRADRGFEFTQLDIEISFTSQEEIMNLIESMLVKMADQMKVKLTSRQFPVFSYQEAMNKFGADKFDLRKDKNSQELAFAWVIKFPLFEKTDDGGWTFTHNPFSSPYPEFESDLLQGKNINKIVAMQYDLVCNGYEVGGGSIRAHKPEVLEAVLKIMGYSSKQIKAKFGHMLEALAFGAPPHGGIALGIERLIAIIQGESSIKEVMAFPMTASGTTSVMDAPSQVTKKQLKELKLAIQKQPKS